MRLRLPPRPLHLLAAAATVVVETETSVVGACTAAASPEEAFAGAPRTSQADVLEADMLTVTAEATTVEMATIATPSHQTSVVPHMLAATGRIPAATMAGEARFSAQERVE